MGVTNISGSFLHELSMVERAQPRGLISGVTMGEVTAHVQAATAPPVLIPLTAGRARITQLLSEATGPLAPPAMQDPLTYADVPTVHQLWCELLDDLGAYLEDLSHADPALRLVGVHRDKLIACIQVTNGYRELTYEVPLDSGKMPAAVTVEIAAVSSEASAAR